MNSDDELIQEISLPQTFYTKICKKVAEIYVKSNITSIEKINPYAIALKLNHVLHPYTKSSKLLKSMIDQYNGDGYSFKDGDIYHIVYDDRTPKVRQRFTIMHEIGHIELGHCHESNLARVMANSFASYALAPYPIINLFEINDYLELSEKFSISPDCAQYCFKKFCNWQQYGGKLKDYEISLISLFH